MSKAILIRRVSLYMVIVCVTMLCAAGTAASERRVPRRTTLRGPSVHADRRVDFDRLMATRERIEARGRPRSDVRPASFSDGFIAQPSITSDPEFVVHSSPQSFQRPHWHWQFLPESILYKAYLAGTKESRLAGRYFSGDSSVHGGDWLFGGTLGGRFGLLRYGNHDHITPQGFQIDVEGSSQLRLNTSDDIDVQATDYRIGIPVTYAEGPFQFKTGYYHLSSHVGDEFMLKNPGFRRLNYARDVLLLGVGYYVTPDLRVYAEAGWAFFSDVANEWEFQFGVDYSPRFPTGTRGAPFAAFNCHLREEVGYGGNTSLQAGWAWRTHLGRLLRVGVHAYNGESNQYSFFDFYEEQIGIGVWYDY